MAALVIAMTMAVGPVTAQVRVQVQPKFQYQTLQPRQQKLQRQPRVQQQVKPRILMIPPSQAAQIAISQNPGAKLLSIKPKGNNYIATMRQGNQVFRVPIPGN